MANTTYLNFAGFQCLENLDHSTVDLYPTTCGIQNCVSKHRFGPGQRDFYILHFVSDGKGIFTCNGKTYQLSRGDAFLIRPHTQVFYEADEQNPWSYMWVGFNGIKAASYLDSAGFQGDRVTTKCDNTPLIFTYIQQMILHRHLTLTNELRREAALLQIIAVLMDEYKESCPKDDRYDYPYQIYVEQALDYIHRNLTRDIKINDLASYIGIDRSYLTGIFKNTVGLSPKEYLLRCRMERAMHLLQTTDQKIAEIATDVGYQNPLTFSKMFHKHTGTSPTEYRKQTK